MTVAPYTSVFDNPGSISAYAAGRTSAADNYILKLGQLAAGLIPPSINPVFPVGTVPPPVSIPTVPAQTPIVWTAPALPAAFSGSLSVGDFLPAPFDAQPPLLQFPAAPQGLTDVIPDAPGVNLAFDLPTLSVSLPSPPQLLSLNIQQFSGVDLPTIDTNLPVLDAIAPSVREYQPGQQYTSALLQAVQQSLIDRITNDSDPLDAKDANAIWNQGRDREAKAIADALMELDRMETQGFSMPPGVFLDARIKITTENAAKNFGLSRDVMIKQAEIEQENIKHALTTAVQIEGNLIQYTNQVEQRLFESCKYATEAGIALYNAKVQAYTAYVDAYKTKVAIYEAQVRTEIAKVDIYKTQIAAEQAKADINKSLVEEYHVLSEVALSNIEIYKAQISAIQTKAEIEKLKVSIYGEQVRGYTARVNAFTAGVEAFRAQVQAEGTKQEAYKAQVQAYTSRVEAAAKAAEVKIEEFKSIIAAKNAEYDGYKAAIAGESARVDAIARTNTAVTDSYRAQIAGLSGYNEVLTKQWQVALDIAERVTEIGVQTAKANAELFVTTRSLALDASKVGAQVSAQLGAAAISAINWSNSVSHSDSYSVSTSNSESHSSSESLNKNYSYS